MRFVACCLLVPFGAALALLAQGCASSPDPNDDASEAELRVATCGRYAAFFSDRSCPTVQGKRGHWEPEALFEEAGDDVRDKSCSYRWVPNATAKPDAKALTAATLDENGYKIGAVAPMCGDSHDPKVVDPQERETPPFLPQVGSVGCDVCGVIHNGKGWVVIPPNFHSPSFPASLTNGKMKEFVLPSNASGAVEVQLPAPPHGASWVDGPIHMH